MSSWVIIFGSLLQDVGLLKQLVDRGQEQCAAVTVARPVVGRERRVHCGGYADSTVDRANPLRWFSEPYECHLRRINDTEHRIDPFFTQVGDGDGRVRHLRAAQRTGSRACHQVGEVTHQLVEVLFGHIVDGGRDKPATA
jgi:hypothetical protein